MERIRVEMEISKDFLYAFDLSEYQISKKLKLLSSIELYREHKISLGKAAEFAEIDIISFQKELFLRDISIIDYNIEDIKDEIDLLTST